MPQGEAMPPLVAAARDGDVEALLAALAAGSPSEAELAQAVYWAACNGHEACLEPLLKLDGSSAAANAGCSSDGETPLFAAAQWGNTACVEALLAAGAAADAPDAFGVTPLAVAARYGHAQCVAAFLNEGASATAPAKDGTTPLGQAAACGSADVAALLLAAGADANDQASTNGWTPLHLAARGGHCECAAVLLSRGASGDAADRDGITPAQLARLRGQTAAAHAIEAVRQAAGSPMLQLLEQQQQQQQQQQQRSTGSRSPPSTADMETGAAKLLAVALKLLQLSSIGDTPFREAPEEGPGTPEPSGDMDSAANSLDEDLRRWRLRHGDLQIKRELGSGSFGKVLLATWHGTPVAVKEFVSKKRPGGHSRTASQLLSDMQKEAALMARMRHPHVVSLIGLTSRPPCLVTEYCPLGSLADVLRKACSDPKWAAQLTWRRRLNMALDAALGLTYLAQRGFVHADVKTPNMLVCASWAIKIGDFNLSKLAGLEGASAGSLGGALNPMWSAPEVLSGSPATAASDVFSYGVVMWELLSWQLPFAESGFNTWQISGFITSGKRLEVPPLDKLPGPGMAEGPVGFEDYVELMQRCWAQDPGSRPGFGAVAKELRALLDRLARISSAL